MSGTAQPWLWRIHPDPQTIGPRQLALLWEPLPFLDDRQAIVDSYMAYDQPDLVGQWPHRLRRWHEHAIHACAVPPPVAPPLATRCALKASPSQDRRCPELVALDLRLLRAVRIRPTAARCVLSAT